MARQSEAGRESPELASAMQPVRRTGAVTYERTRVTGRPRPELSLISMNRRCEQPLAGALCQHGPPKRICASCRAIWKRTASRLAFTPTKRVCLRTRQKQTRRAGRRKMRRHCSTQIGRALKKLDTGWIAVHSSQAKGGVERGFWSSTRSPEGFTGGSCQDAGASQRLSETEFLP